MAPWRIPLELVLDQWLDSVVYPPIKLDDRFLLVVYGKTKAESAMSQKLIEVLYGTNEIRIVPIPLETNARGTVFGGAHGSYMLGFQDNGKGTNKKDLLWQTVDDRTPWTPGAAGLDAQQVEAIVLHVLSKFLSPEALADIQRRLKQA